MDELQKLLSVVESLDPEKRGKEESPPTDEELTEAKQGLVEALKVAASGDKPDLEAARTLRQAIDQIGQEEVSRTEQREKDAAEAAKLLEGLDGKAEASDEENEDAEADKDGETAGDDEKNAEDIDTSTSAKVTVAASLAEALNRSGKRKIDRVVEDLSNASVIVSSLGPAQGAQLSQDATLDDVAKIFNQYAPQVKRGGSVFVHLEKLYPPERALGLSVEENTRIIESVTAPRVLTAAGGVCEPLPADFTHPICGDRGRPIFNANPIFRADRGGIRAAPSATVADLEGNITVWTSETDADPGSDTKACPRVDCEDEISEQVDAIVACITVGNFQARFNPEFWRSRLDLLMVAHDRIAEQTLYATIESGSTQVTTFDSSEGTVVSLLQAADLAVAGISSRHRLIGTGFTAILPSWTRDAMRSHLANQAPAGSVDPFAVADAQLNNFFTTRRITPVWSPDVDEFGAQAAGALVDWPGGNVDLVIYPNGTWLTLDGGTLDLGTQVVDSTLNAVNDRQAFMETFEAVMFRGCESLSIAVTVAETCICGA